MKNKTTKKFTIKTKLWDCWRKEEKVAADYVLKGHKGISAKELKNSYFLRDLTVSYLATQKITAFELAARLKNALSLTYDPHKLIVESIGCWIGVKKEHGVQAYLTPKSILYTLRGDYNY